MQMNNPELFLWAHYQLYSGTLKRKRPEIPSSLSDLVMPLEAYCFSILPILAHSSQRLVSIVA